MLLNAELIMSAGWAIFNTPRAWTLFMGLKRRRVRNAFLLPVHESILPGLPSLNALLCMIIVTSKISFSLQDFAADGNRYWRILEKNSLAAIKQEMRRRERIQRPKESWSDGFARRFSHSSHRIRNCFTYICCRRSCQGTPLTLSRFMSIVLLVVVCRNHYKVGEFLLLARTTKKSTNFVCFSSLN